MSPHINVRALIRAFGRPAACLAIGLLLGRVLPERVALGLVLGLVLWGATCQVGVFVELDIIRHTLLNIEDHLAHKDDPR